MAAIGTASFEVLDSGGGEGSVVGAGVFVRPRYVRRVRQVPPHGLGHAQFGLGRRPGQELLGPLHGGENVLRWRSGQCQVRR